MRKLQKATTEEPDPVSTPGRRRRVKTQLKGWLSLICSAPLIPTWSSSHPTLSVVARRTVQKWIESICLHLSKSMRRVMPLPHRQQVHPEWRVRFRNLKQQQRHSRLPSVRRVILSKTHRTPTVIWRINVMNRSKSSSLKEMPISMVTHRQLKRLNQPWKWTQIQSQWLPTSHLQLIKSIIRF